MRACWLTLLLPCACQGPPGEAGPPGQDGAPGEDGPPGEEGTDTAVFETEVRGQVDASSPADIPVALELLGPDGAVIAGLASARTDANGQFSLHLANLEVPSTLLRLRASTPDGEQTALVYGAEVHIGPVSAALDTVIDWIVASEGQATLADYTTDEYAALLADAEAALSGVDLGDPAQVLAATLERVGWAIAAASGGDWTAAVSDLPVLVDPPDLSTPGAAGEAETLVDGLGYSWEINTEHLRMESGALSRLLFWGNLDLEAETVLDGGRPHTIEDGRELVLAPFASANAPGVELTRKVYVSPDEGFVRYLELLTNTGSTTQRVDIELLFIVPRGSLAFGATSSGDATLETGDAWFSLSRVQGLDNAGGIFPGTTRYNLYAPDGEAGPEWQNTRIRAGETVAVLSWALQRPAGRTDDLEDELRTLCDSTTGMPLLESWYEGLSRAELESSLVPALGRNIRGEAGAATPYAALTVTNLTTGERKQVSAQSDGAFWAAIPASSGDEIQIESEYGDLETLGVP